MGIPPRDPRLTNTLPSARHRHRMAIAVAIVFALFGLLSPHAGAGVDGDHASACVCGPKCKPNRCCCESTSPKQAAPGFDQPRMPSQTGHAQAAQAICRIRSNCMDPAGSRPPARLRIRLETFCGHRVAGDRAATSASLPELVTIFPSSPFENRLERPPRLSNRHATS